MTLSAPVPLGAEHDSSGFDSGQPSLDDWLRRRALANQKAGASRTYVVCEGKTVVAYYAVASGALACTSGTSRFRRNMPDPIPVAILVRLAIDRGWQRQGLGRALFRDAARRILHASDTIGIRGLVVHALTEEAASFYQALGLTPAPGEPLLLMVTLEDLRAFMSFAQR